MLLQQDNPCASVPPPAVAQRPRTCWTTRAGHLRPAIRQTPADPLPEHPQQPVAPPLTAITHPGMATGAVVCPSSC